MSAITDDEIAASLLCASVPQHPDCMQCRLLARIRADAATIADLRRELAERDRELTGAEDVGTRQRERAKAAERKLADADHYIAEANAKIARLEKVADAARALVGWDWLRLLPDTRHGVDVAEGVDAIETALAALDGAKEGS